MDITKTTKAKDDVQNLLFSQGVSDFGIGIRQEGADYIVTVYIYNDIIPFILPDYVNDIPVKILKMRSCPHCD